MINLTHSDLDGAISAILVNEYANQKNISCNIIKARYDTIDEIFSYNYKKDDYIIITDISLKNEPEWISSVNNVLLIDHHSGVERSKIKDKNKIIDSSEGTSACKLVYNYFTSKVDVPIFNEDFKRLMIFGHDYDSWTHEYKSSKSLNYLYYFYHFERFVDRFKFGFKNFTKDEILFLKCKNNEIKNILTNMDYSVINDDVAFIIENDNLNEIAEELYMNRGFKYVFMYSPKRKVLSLRSHKDAIIHCGEFLQVFGGGGHRCSGGISVSGDAQISEVLKGFEVVYDEYHPVF